MTGDTLLHDKPHFFKYCTSDTLERILTNRTVKWSSPKHFNDPFDIQTDFRFGFEFEELEEPFIQEQLRIVLDAEEPQGDLNNLFFQMLLRTRDTRIRNPSITRSEIEALIRGSELNHGQLAETTRQNQQWWKELREQDRVFCVSEIHDDLLMWAHYAKNHSGAVFQYKVIPGHDYAICAALQVQYESEMPVIADLGTYVKHVTGQKELDFSKINRDFITTKSSHWAYEKEWRCVGAAAFGSTDPFLYNPIQPEEIGAIYFGCRMTEEKRAQLTELITSDLSHVKLYQARVHSRKYELVFDEI